MRLPRLHSSLLLAVLGFATASQAVPLQLDPAAEEATAPAAATALAALATPAEQTQVDAVLDACVALRRAGQDTPYADCLQQLVAALRARDQTDLLVKGLENQRAQAKAKKDLVPAQMALHLYTVYELEESQSAVLTELARIARELSQFPMALDYLDRAIALDHKLKDAHGEMLDLEEQAQILGQQRHDAEAIAKWQAALALADGAHSAVAQMRIHAALGEQWSRQKNAAETRRELTLALDMARKMDDSTLSQQLTDAAQSYVRTGLYAEAQALYEECLALDTRLGAVNSVAVDHELIGDLHFSQAHFEPALAAYQQALAADRQQDVPRRIANDLQNVALAQSGLGRVAEAQAALHEAIEVAQRADGAAQARAWTQLGRSFSATGDYPAAEQAFRSGLKALESSDDVGAALELRADYAHVAYQQGDYASALERYDAALKLAEAIGQPWRIQAVELSRAEVRAAAGDFKSAEADARGVLADAERTQQDLVIGNARLMLGQIAREQGDFPRAKTEYEQALKVYRDRQLEENAGALFNQLGQLYADAGDVEQAEHWQRKALEVAKKLGDVQGQSAAINNIGAVYMDNEDYAKAYEQFMAAIELTRDMKNFADYSIMVGNAGCALSRMGQHENGLRKQDEAVKIMRLTTDRRMLASTLAWRGETLTALGRSDEAIASLEESRRLAVETNYYDALWRSQANLGIALRKAGRKDEAVFYGKQAVDVLQRLRQSAAGVVQAKAGFLRDKRYAYEQLAQSLFDLGRLPEGQQVLDLLTEAEVASYGATRSVARTTAQTADEGRFDARKRSDEDDLFKLSREYDALKAVPDASRTPEQKTRYAELQNQLRQRRAQYEALKTEIRNYFAQSESAELANQHGRELDALGSFRGVLKRVGGNAVLLYYLATPSKLYITLTTPEVQLVRTADIGSDALRKLVKDYRRTLRNPRKDARPQAQELYRYLMAPVAADLEQAGARLLVVAPYQDLRYLPWAALHDGQKWVAERYAVSLLTPAAEKSLAIPPTGDWRVAAFGVSQGGRGLSPLPSVKEEVAGIVQTPAGVGVLPGESRLDGDFTPQALTDALEQGYPVVHIASHFHFAPQNEFSSYLLLGGGQELSLGDLRVGSYPMDSVDFIALSACETALDSVTGDGREISSLGAQLQEQGARAVLATLWQVADRSTGVFMQGVYAEHSRQGISKAEAIRRVQEAFIRGEPQVAGISLEARGGARRGGPAAAAEQGDTPAPWSHPFYWAPFILMGNWL